MMNNNQRRRCWLTTDRRQRQAPPPFGLSIRSSPSQSSISSTVIIAAKKSRIVTNMRCRLPQEKCPSEVVPFFSAPDTEQHGSRRLIACSHPHPSVNPNPSQLALTLRTMTPGKYCQFHERYDGNSWILPKKTSTLSSSRDGNLPTSCSYHQHQCFAAKSSRDLTMEMPSSSSSSPSPKNMFNAQQTW